MEAAEVAVGQEAMAKAMEPTQADRVESPT